MTESKVIGLIPAAGAASRLWHLPTSKELLPLGFMHHEEEGKARRIPKVISHYLLDQFALAEIRQVIMILTREKLDILQYYDSGNKLGMDIGYVCVDKSISMPHSIARAHAWHQDRTIAFGMPDTIFSPPDAVRKLFEFHRQQNADLSLGLFRTQEPWRFGMVEMDDAQQVIQCIDKPSETFLEWMWGIACWEPTFSDMLLDRVASFEEVGKEEIVLGDIFQAAIEANLRVFGLPFDGGEYLDIGTSEAYEQAIVSLQRFDQ